MDRKELITKIDSLCVYSLGGLTAVNALKRMLCADNESELCRAWSVFFRTLCENGCADNFSGFISREILYDDNIFSRAASQGERLPYNIINAVKRDLDILQELSQIKPSDFYDIEGDEIRRLPLWETGEAVAPLCGCRSECIESLSAYHKLNGCGIFARYKAFCWRNGGIAPIIHTNPIKLSGLKSYEYQRGLVVDNTVSFLEGLPANNVLLYGDRGTGKSSTVHAILNEFGEKGLRMIEMPKNAVCDFPLLIKELSGIGLKFIIFIDDLSFSSHDDGFAQLKAALEGGLSAKRSNMLIYATSNRRHLVREKFSDRDGDELHAADTIQEQASLADRFGLSVTFINPDKSRYFEILDAIASDRGLDIDLEKLHKRGEQWALERGGRSPRAGVQFINTVEAKIKRGLDW